MDAEKATVALKEVKAFWTQQFKNKLKHFLQMSSSCRSAFICASDMQFMINH